MRKLLVFIELSIFFLLLSFVFFAGDVSAQITIDKNFTDYHYKWDYKENYEGNSNNYFPTEHIVKNDNFPLNGFFAPVTVRSNSLTNYYQWTNSITFQSNGYLHTNCNKGTCDITGMLFALDSNDNYSDFDYLLDSKVYFGISTDIREKYYKTAEKIYPCDLKKKDKYYEFSCSVPYNALGNGKTYIRVDLENKPFTDISSMSTYAENIFKIGLSSQFNYDCSLFELPELSVSVDGGTVTISVTNMDIFNNDPDFNRFQVRHEHRVLGVEFSSSDTYIFDNVPNGEYTFSISACKSGQECGSRAYVTYVVSNSLAPVPRVTVTDDGKNITVDGSESTGYNGKAIAKYYYKVYLSGTDEPDWVESSSSSYTFECPDYGMYHVHFKVIDVDGNISRDYITSFAHRSELDKFIIAIKDFFSNIGTHITNMFDSFWKYWTSQIDLKLSQFFDATKRLFIPDMEFMQNWFNDLMEEFEQQLGFLSYPTTWLITFLNRFLSLTDTGHYVIHWGNINVPNFDFAIIKSGSFDLAVILENPTLKNMHDIYIMVINALMLLSFFSLCHKTYDRIFNLPSTTTEYLTVSDGYINSTTIDDDGNVIEKPVSYTSSVRTGRKMSRRVKT